jgi:porphobilinogen synthase
MAFPITRLRRLRANPTVRDMLRETRLSLDDLIYPIFVEEELDDFAPVESMPGVHRSVNWALRSRRSAEPGSGR